MFEIIWRTYFPTYMRMTRYLMCFCMLLLYGVLVDSMSLPAISWNSSNSMFKTSNNKHVVEVNLYDEIDFVCPYHERTSDPNQFEYYIIHQVSKRVYETCDLDVEDTERPPVMIVNCSEPSQQKRFTILFEPFSAIPNTPEFKEGGTYYYISTSTGTLEGMGNKHEGACLYKNMKVTIKVCCSTTTLPPTTTTTPRPTTSATTTRRTTASTRTKWKTTTYNSTDKKQEEKPTKDEDKKDENETHPEKQELVRSGSNQPHIHGLLLLTSLLTLYSNWRTSFR